MNHNRCYNRVAKPPSCNIYPRFTPDEKPCKLYAFRCASFLTHPAVNRTAAFHRHNHVCWFCVMSLALLGEATVRSTANQLTRLPPPAGFYMQKRLSIIINPENRSEVGVPGIGK